MSNAKLNRATDQRLALIKNQVSELLWRGRLETTVARAKSVQRVAEKLLTAAIRSYEDTTIITKKKLDDKGKEVSLKVMNDGPKKLAARRKLMSKLNDLQEPQGKTESNLEYRLRTKEVAHPLIEKMFNELAPKYAKREKESGQGGGYTRIVKLGARKGDAAEMVLIELV